jgi:anti-sigma regulatory factor (Ser/Thr protein kinase)
MPRERTSRIRAFLAQAISEGRPDVVRRTARRFGITRQAVQRHLRSLVADGILAATGRTRGRIYALQVLAEKTAAFSIAQHPEEDAVWRECFAGLVASIPENVRDICHYGFTEMFNNAVDHSEGDTVTATLTLTGATVKLSVLDDGVGIFRKIQVGLKLADERRAVEAVTHGKVTTDPEHHTGEGIFFTMRMFDGFSLRSGRLGFNHKTLDNDWAIEGEPSEMKGTLVRMSIATRSGRTALEVFDRYTSRGDVPTFDRTDVPVKLLRIGGESLVSRSQAKRLLARCRGFKEVMLDFEGVKEIGQAFADEVFRVFRNQNPSIRIVWTRANRDVEQMIKRVLGEERPPSRA